VFFNVQAFILVGVTSLLCVLVYHKHRKASLISMVSINQLMVLVLSLSYAVIKLSRLADVSELGVIISLVLLSNLYAGVLNLGARLYNI